MLRSIEASDEAVEKTGLVHRIYLPDGCTEVDKPLVIMAHGRGGNSASMWTFSKAFLGVKPIVVSPQGMIVVPDGGYCWWEVIREQGTERSGYRATSMEDLEDSTYRMLHFLLGLREVYRFDTRRVFGIGFSQGAALLSSLSLRHPGLFEGVAMLSGYLPDVAIPARASAEVEVESKIALPDYFISHGTKDEVLPIRFALKACGDLESLGAQVTFHSEEVGHKLGSDGAKALSLWFEGLQGSG